MESGFADADVGATAAKVAAETLFDIGLGAVGVAFDEALDGHDETGGAVPALLAIVFDEGGGNGVELAGGCDAFDGLDVAALGIDGEDGAAVHSFAVDNHGAGSAGAAVADALGSRDAGVIAEGVEQGDAGFDGELGGFAVEAQGDGHCVGAGLVGICGFEVGGECGFE